MTLGMLQVNSKQSPLLHLESRCEGAKVKIEKCALVSTDGDLNILILNTLPKKILQNEAMIYIHL